MYDYKFSQNSWDNTPFVRIGHGWVCLTIKNFFLAAKISSGQLIRTSAHDAKLTHYKIIISTCLVFRIVKFLEKPKPEDTQSRLASPVFYCLRKDTLPLVTEYTEQYKSRSERAMGMFMVRSDPLYQVAERRRKNILKIVQMCVTLVWRVILVWLFPRSMHN